MAEGEFAVGAIGTEFEPPEQPATIVDVAARVARKTSRFKKLPRQESVQIASQKCDVMEYGYARCT